MTAKATRTRTNCFLLLGITLAALMAPLVLFAQGINPPADFGGIGNTFESFIDFLNNILVPLVFALAFIVFIWGMFNYFILSGASDEGRKQGSQLMIWATAGFVLMVCVWGITNVVASSLGFTGRNLQTIPTIPVPTR